MDWPSLIEKFGLAYTLLFGLIGGFVWLIRWSLTNVVVPVKDAHINYLNETKEQTKEQTAKLAELKNGQDAMHSKIDGMATFMGKLNHQAQQ
jgi:hypothetical protein